MSNTTDNTKLQDYLGDLVEALARQPRAQLEAWRDMLATTRTLYMSMLDPEVPGVVDLMAETDYHEALIGIATEVLKWMEVPNGDAA